MLNRATDSNAGLCQPILNNIRLLFRAHRQCQDGHTDSVRMGSVGGIVISCVCQSLHFTLTHLSTVQGYSQPMAFQALPKGLQHCYAPGTIKS